MTTRILTTLLFTVLYATSLMADESVHIDSLVIRDGKLYLSYHSENFINSKAVESLQRGITSEVNHHVQLWKRKTFFSPVEANVRHSVKLFYDNWENKFRIVTESENRLTSSVESVREKTSLMEHMYLIDRSALEHGQEYYISINITFRPVSAETYQALRGMVDGKSQPQETKEDSSRGTIFGVLMNLMGFGDKEISEKSRNFVLTSSGNIEFVD